jgi:hypothetical protein
MATVENFMAGPQLPDDQDTSASENRFAQNNVRGYSSRSSAIVIAAIVVIVGMVFMYLSMQPGDHDSKVSSQNAPAAAPAH